MAKTISVQFQKINNQVGRIFEGLIYTYNLDDDSVKVDDLVVLDSRSGWALAKVLTVDDTVRPDNKWAVCKVDTAAYLVRREREAKKSRLFAALEGRMREVDKMEAFRDAAAHDDVMAELLKEYDELETADAQVT